MSFPRLAGWIVPIIACMFIVGGRCSAAPLTYRISFLDSTIPIDGNPAQWHGHGLNIDQLTPLDGATMPTASECDASVRLGWDPRGLVVLVQVTDPNISESTDDTDLGGGDAVELELAPSRGSSSNVRIIVAPPLDAMSAAFRSQIIDNRRGSLAKIPINDPLLDSVLTPTGYVVEALLRWDDLNITAAKGQTVAFQVCVDHKVKKQTITLGWFPQSGATPDTTQMNTLLLSKLPEQPVMAAANTSYPMFRYLEAQVYAPAGQTGNIATISEFGKVVGRAALTAQNGRAEATIDLPAPTQIRDYATLTLSLNGRAFQRIDLPNFQAACATQFGRERLTASQFVFTGDEFPQIYFEHPALVENLIGPYTVSARYFDNGYAPVTAPGNPGRYGAAVDITAANGVKYHRYMTLFHTPDKFSWDSLPADLGARTAISAGIEQATETTNSEDIRGEFVSALGRSYSASEQLARALGVLFEDTSRVPVRISSDADKWAYELQKSLGDPQQYHYMLVLPADYHSDPTKRWPLVLFLHGAGERGSDLTAIDIHGPPLMVSEGRQFPFILVAPQCPDSSSWNTAKLSDILDSIEATHRVDRSRVYLTGLSMGGFATWNLAMDEPTRFAAIAPMSSGADPDFAKLLIKVPIWVFHGDADETVKIEYDQAMVDALKSEGADVKFTIVHNGRHAIWDPIYAGDDIYRWLLSHHLPL